MAEVGHVSDRGRLACFHLQWGPQIGWGHLVRCAALAEELQKREWRTGLWSSGDFAGMPEEFRRAFDEVFPFRGFDGSEFPGEISEADWLVVDHYGVGDVQLAQIRIQLANQPQGRARLLVVDDEAKRRLGAANLVLNMRLGVESSPYEPGVDALLGESYALLRSGLLGPKAIANPFAEALAPVLVMLGGADPLGATPAVLHGLADVAASAMAPVLVHRRGGANDLAIAEAMERFGSSIWLEGLGASELAGWAQLCRFAVSALGGTVYELGLFELPFVGVVVADNQRLLADTVARRWKMPVVDGAAGDLRARVASAFCDLERVRPVPFGIDGKSAARVAEAMEQRLVR